MAAANQLSQSHHQNATTTTITTTTTTTATNFIGRKNIIIIIIIITIIINYKWPSEKEREREAFQNIYNHAEVKRVELFCGRYNSSFSKIQTVLIENILIQSIKKIKSPTINLSRINRSIIILSLFISNFPVSLHLWDYLKFKHAIGAAISTVKRLFSCNCSKYIKFT
ncbi:hypothetical protein T06_1998 [Trichinella sp. T6]|nr:hypothetical protein T06_1998 [Trichinella sp. T6]